MACDFCTHWNKIKEEASPTVGIVERVAVSVGVCTLTPTWIETTGLHHCSQLKLDASFLVGHYFKEVHFWRDAVQQEKTKRREVEKKLKESRRRLREHRR
jgi:hypothetical protein